ncbi:MAG: ligase-associated DNA damage response endonuclease PdeM [Planctomycetota bacterium]
MTESTIQLRDHVFELLSAGAVFWSDQNAVVVADLHLGKDATFRSASIGVPVGSTQRTLDRLAETLEQTGATKLFILGDLFHARSSLRSETIGPWERFLVEHSEINRLLVMGNHDQHVGRLPDRWGLKVQPAEAYVNDVHLVHAPDDAERARSESNGKSLSLCGHIHPAFRMTARHETLGKLPCFWWRNSKQQLILPAFGDFTGTHAIRCEVGDQVWVMADDELIAVGRKGPSVVAATAGAKGPAR